MLDKVRIKSKSGAESEVLRESLDAWLAQGEWSLAEQAGENKVKPNITKPSSE